MPYGGITYGLGSYKGEGFFTVSAFVDKNLNFVENNFNFSAETTDYNFDIDWVKKYTFCYNGSVYNYTDTVNVDQYSYLNKGIYSNNGVIVSVRNSSDVEVLNGSDLSIIVSANPLPVVDFLGTPLKDSVVNFVDGSAELYFSNSIVSADWDFGDGNLSSTTNIFSVLDHIYTSKGIFSVNISAYDISGNVGTNNKQIYIFEDNICSEKEDYITLCNIIQSFNNRFGSCRLINLVEYLPLYLRGGETEKFLQFFEDFLNEMYSGLCGWQLSENNLPITESYIVENPNTVSADVKINSNYDINESNVLTESTDAKEIKLDFPENFSLPTSAHKISILEKIHRLTELHDPDLIDLDYLQFFAHNLGYNVNVSRNEIGNSGTTEQFGFTEFSNSCSADEINRYLRFVVANLPTWYKIKSTNSAIKVMLYSFGLVSEVIEYFTDSYKDSSEGGQWRANLNKNLETIDNTWFPTPHFTIYVDFDTSSDISFEIDRRRKIIRAIESIRPINTVLEGLTGYVKRLFPLTAAGYIRSSKYCIINSNGYSNGWGI